MQPARSVPILHPTPDHSGETPLIGLAALMRMAYGGADLRPVRDALTARLRADATDASALMDLSILLQLTGERERGLGMQAHALAIHRVYHRPCGRGDGVRVLAICVAGDFMANTPIDFLLEGSNVDLWLAYVDAQGALPDLLPDHDVALLAIGESPETGRMLSRLQDTLRHWPEPTMNGHADRIAALTRDGVSTLLADDPCIEAPPVARLDRTGLASQDRFPFIARPIGAHAGQGLVKLETPAMVADYLGERTEAEFYVAPFVDYRSADGLYRKQRIVFVRGRPFVCHMAISDYWMVHYLSAGMTGSAEKRAEEAAFMQAFDADFAVRHARAFASLHEKIGLDYFGVDCAETRDGRLLLFEVDVAMIVHALDPEPDFSYKIPVMRRMFAAFADALSNTAGADSERGAAKFGMSVRAEPAFAAKMEYPFPRPSLVRPSML